VKEPSFLIGVIVEFYFHRGVVVVTGLLLIRPSLTPLFWSGEQEYLG
jgi:hypothetical protein